MRISTVLQGLVLLQIVLVATACHWACATCFGPNQNQCTTCAVSFYLQPTAPTTCLPTCPAGYYGNNALGQCSPCDVSCARCSWSPVACDACAPGYTWSGAYCVLSAQGCPPGQYWSGTACLPCHSSCATCTGGAINQCSSCPSGNFLNANNRCKPCTSPCSQCDGPATHCTACIDGYYLSGNTCLPCHADCATCSGGAANQCLSCKPAKPVLVGTGCYPQCTGTTLANGQIKCTTCDVSCKNNNCRDAAVNCVNCKNNYHLDNGLCIHNRL